MGLSELRGVVALDGPSGTGKSTAARHLASGLGARYLDTGAMYRAATLAVLRARIDPNDQDGVVSVVKALDLIVTTDPEHPVTMLAGMDVSSEIREQAVTTAVSPVSAHPEVRRLLVDSQRQIIAQAVAEVGGIVVEGRDIGATVAPNAELKVYLTASARIRAERRAKQHAAAGLPADVDEILADIARRDAHDSGRVTSPTRKADDAIELDTTHLDLPATERKLLDLIEARGLRQTVHGKVIS